MRAVGAGELALCCHLPVRLQSTRALRRRQADCVRVTQICNIIICFPFKSMCRFGISRMIKKDVCFGTNVNPAGLLPRMLLPLRGQTREVREGDLGKSRIWFPVCPPDKSHRRSHDKQPHHNIPMRVCSRTSGDLECGHLGKFAHLTFPVIYSGKQERCHSLKALIRRIRNLQQPQKQWIKKSSERRYMSCSPICAGLGSSRSNSEQR